MKVEKGLKQAKVYKAIIQKGLKLGGGNAKLSKSEAYVLYGLTDDFLTIKKIALARKTSVQAVYKIVNRLKAKNYLTGTSYKGFKKTGVTPQKGLKLKPGKKIRLHGEAWRLNIIDKSSFYDKMRLKRSNRFDIDNNHVQLNRDSIVIYCSEGRSFYADSVYEATRLSVLYWNKIFSRLENRLNLTLIKSEYLNVKRFRQHYAETNNEIAEDCNKKKVNIKIFAPEDGKLWFTIDNSFNLNEAETQHPETAEEDLVKVKNVFDDIRRKPSLLPSEITKAIGDITKIQKQEVSKMNYYAENIKSHVGAIQELGSKVEAWSKATEGMNKLLKKLNKKL